jgi:hypothetical protein
LTDYLRLALATGVVLLPGALVARALGRRGASATLAWAFAALFVAWAVVFTLHTRAAAALWTLAGIGVCALLARAARTAAASAASAASSSAAASSSSRPSYRVTMVTWWKSGRAETAGGRRGGGLVLLAGVAVGIALWHVAGVVSGDGLFHLARVRKLVALGDLHLRSVDELAGGGLHPGYAFPLWHGFLALVAKVSGLDPSVVVSHEASILAPLACLVAFEAGVGVFGSPWAGAAVVVASLALYCFAAGHGGAWTSLALPATAARQLFVPAAAALFFAADLPSIAVVFGALSLVHPTYTLFALIPLAGYALVRLGEWRRSLGALAAAAAPAGLAYLWLRPLVDETVSHNPGPAELARALAHYAGELVVGSPHHYRLAAAVPARSGAVAVAALALVPLAGLAARRRWGAYVLGGTLAVLALELVPQLFVRFSDLVSLSQSRRAAGFVPFAFAFAGGLALLARSLALAPLALLAGIVLQAEWPGDFAYGLPHGAPGAVTWIALLGGAAALAAGLVLRARVRERWLPGAVAGVLFVVPVAVHAARSWTPAVPRDPHALSPRLLAELRRVPPGAVVIAAPQVSYRLAAAAPVYVVAAPPAHVADTRANRPYRRVREVEAWLAGRAPDVPRRYGATWAVRQGRLYRLPTAPAPGR